MSDDAETGTATMTTMARQHKAPDIDPANPWPARLLALRLKLGITQAEAAAKIKASRNSWINWEQGHKTPSPPHALLLELLEAGKI